MPNLNENASTIANDAVQASYIDGKMPTERMDALLRYCATSHSGSAEAHGALAAWALMPVSK